MSRHELDPRPAYARYRIAVGWDPPLNTFFAHVHTGRGILLWIGTSYNEIHDHATVLDAVRKYADVPAGLDAKLYGEANG